MQQQQQPNPVHMQQQQQQPILQQPVLDPLEIADPNIMASMEVSNSLASDLDGMCLMHAYYKKISVYYFGWFFSVIMFVITTLFVSLLGPKSYYHYHASPIQFFRDKYHTVRYEQKT